MSVERREDLCFIGFLTFALKNGIISRIVVFTRGFLPPTRLFENTQNYVRILLPRLRFYPYKREMHPGLASDQNKVEALASLKLTPREAEVLFWISQGKTNRDIGIILGAKTGTVCKHVEHIFGKLKVENRTSAAMVALEACHSAAPASENNSYQAWAAISGLIAMVVQEFCSDACEICGALSSLAA